MGAAGSNSILLVTRERESERDHGSNWTWRRRSARGAGGFGGGVKIAGMGRNGQEDEVGSGTEVDWTGLDCLLPSAIL
jgi:hypothetical protein